MKALLPGPMLIGFTGTPLLKDDKRRSIETFGPYIHTYKYDEAVRDGVVLDLRYEARDIDQNITSQAKIDQWFDLKTRGLTDLAKAQLKQRWGTMRKVLSARDRLEKIVADILLDMETRDRLKSGHGNAPGEAGHHSVVPPRRIGGNLDIRDLAAGTTTMRLMAEEVLPHFQGLDADRLEHAPAANP
jgi:type I restriction enzyme R subunit